nr:vacuolar protein sorting-associated protein 13C-like [Salvelinus alpinus]
MKASGKMFNNGAMEVSTILTACTLDDMRTGVQRVTSRMLGKRDETSEEAMIDVTYTQECQRAPGGGGVTEALSVATLSFLMAGRLLHSGPAPELCPGRPTNTMLALPDLAKTSQLPLKQLAELRDRATTDPRTGKGRDRGWGNK